MPVRQVTVIEDSIDGKPLDPETQPLTISVDRKSWKLYLSDANREKVLDQIAKWTLNEPEEAAEAFQAHRKTSPGKAKRDSAQLAAIRNWATANGHEVSARGRIPREIEEKYYATH
jgi:nucleoid-associated protein Lsr2